MDASCGSEIMSRREKSRLVVDTPAMRLYVEPMDTVVIEVNAEGSVRYEQDGWSRPSLQERRAIIYAATQEMEALTELLEFLEKSG